MQCQVFMYAWLMWDCMWDKNKRSHLTKKVSAESLEDQELKESSRVKA